jgi:hypothetical protein
MMCGDSSLTSEKGEKGYAGSDLRERGVFCVSAGLEFFEEEAKVPEEVLGLCLRIVSV